jgi:hypothetical protein
LRPVTIRPGIKSQGPEQCPGLGEKIRANRATKP